MFRNWLRRLAWKVVQKTNDPNIPHVVYKHKCGSESVIPLGKYFSGWEEPAFECLGCGCLTNKDIEVRLVDPADSLIQAKREAGLTILHPQY
jgi:hypothetical protein